MAGSLNKHSGIILTILIIGAAFVVMPPGLTQPEKIHFNRFSDEEGLPNNLFKKIIEDHEGFLWMSGSDGLARYDGYEVTSYRHSHLDSTSISGNNISTLFEDAQGRLWIGCVGSGINVSNESKTRFRQVRLSENSIRGVSFVVDEFTEDSLGSTWIATNAGLFIVKNDNGQLTGHPYDVKSAGDSAMIGLNRPTSLFTDKKGNVWVGTKSGLYTIDPASGNITLPGDFTGLPQHAIQDIGYDREDRIWVSCENDGARLFYLPPQTKVFRPFSGIPVVSYARVVSFAFDLDNRIWVSVFGDQAFGYDFRDSTLFFQSTVNSNIALERFLRKPLIDHSGTVWIPCEGFYTYPFPKGFSTYLHPYAFHQSNTCIYGDHDFLWMAYREKGLVRLNKATGQTDLFSTQMKAPFNLPVDHIQVLLHVNSGNMIMVGFNNVSVLSGEGYLIKSYPVNGTNRAAYQDKKGRIWIGGYKGLYLFSEDRGVIKTYVLPATDGDDRNFIQSILEDAQGDIWFASDLKGLAVLNPDAEAITQFLPVEGDPSSMPGVSILDIAIDDANIIWAATDVGLVRFDPVSHAIKLYDRSFGLSNDYISSIVCTDEGLIWISTHSGISSFDPATEIFVNYGSADGLSNLSYYSRSVYDGPDGTLYFGGKNGVDYFQPSRLRKNPTAPLLVLSSISLNHQRTIYADDIRKADSRLTLSYQDRLVEIEITGLHIADQKEVHYMYKIDELNKEWVDLGKRRSILFSGLAPGDYMFRAKAESSDHIWSEKELSIPIYVSPPFYSTLWFRGLAFILLLSGIILIIKSRERKIKKKDKAEAEINQKIAGLEKRALQAQMNPHFIYNSMNSIQQFMIMHDMEGAMKYLTRFSRILRTVLHISSQNRVPLYDEIKLIEDYLELENMRFPNKFKYSINVDRELNIHTIEIPPFFIQPQVENAIRHGLLKKETQGELLVEIKKEGNNMRIIVEDNGVGRKASQESKSKQSYTQESKGLAITEERLKHLHQGNGYHPIRIIDLVDSSGDATGTRVEITLPLDDE